MKTDQLVLVSLLLALAAAVPANASPSSACEHARPGGDARACAAAERGPDSLRRFIERTRTIYGLYYGDYGDFSSRDRAPARKPAMR